MSHQAHNIPWNTLAANVIYYKDHPQRVKNQIPIVCNRRLPGEAKTCNFFVKKLARTIEEFTASEQARYLKVGAFPQAKPSSKIPLIDGERMIKDLIERYENSESFKMQEMPESDIREVVKWLLSGDDEDMETLITLARHPDVNLRNSFNCLTHLCNYGWRVVGDYAFMSYVFFNTMVAYQASSPGPKHMWSPGGYKKMRPFQGTFNVAEIITNQWYPGAQSIIHRDFLWKTHTEKDPGPLSYQFLERVRDDIFDDADRLHAYLKNLFRIIVRFNILMNEIGEKVDWEDKGVEVLSNLFSFPYITYQIKEGEVWKNTFVLDPATEQKCHSRQPIGGP
jgi:hypothetical protein